MAPTTHVQCIELRQLPLLPTDREHSTPNDDMFSPHSHPGHPGVSSHSSGLAHPERTGSSFPPDDAIVALQTWKSSRSNVIRTLAVFWSLLIMGANDASYGVSWYNEQYNVVIMGTNVGFMFYQAIIPHVSSAQDLFYR